MICWLPPLTLALAAIATQFDLQSSAAPPKQAAGTAPAPVGAEYVEDLPGVRTGSVSPAARQANTSIINRRLATGAQLRLRPGSRIEIGSSLRLGSGAAIIGDSNTNKPTIFMPAAAFDNREDAAGEGRYGLNAVGINFSGELSGTFRPSHGVRIENVRLRSEQRTGRRLRAIVGQNVTACVVRNVEISGFPMATGLVLASARGCRISNVYVHDFSDDTAWTVLPQSTGIEIDNDIVNRVPSSDTVIEGFRIERLRVSGPLLAKWGYQTDGINVMNNGSRVQIQNGGISDVGEGIDTFGSYGTISDVIINNAYIFGLKFIHGASRNTVRNVTITNVGLAGVNFSGSNQAARDTAGNVITGITITNIDPFGTWRQNSTAGILVSGKGARRAPTGNQVISADIDLGPNGKYGWLDQSTGSANRGTGLRVKGGRSLHRAVLILHGGGSVSLRDRPPQ